MLSRLAVSFHCQLRSIGSSIRLMDRFSRDSIRSRIRQYDLKPAFKQQGRQTPHISPNASDVIPIRPTSDLIKAFGFSVGVVVVSFSVAAISDYENNKTRIKNFITKSHEFFKEFGQPIERREVSVRELSPGEKCAALLIFSNCLVTILWKVKALQPMLWKWFTNSYASRALCLPMALSLFSHISLIHLGLNMYVLHTFTQVAIDKFFGSDQFWAFYVSAGVFSSFFSIANKAIIRSPIRALGASGAILAVLTYTCCKIPDARLSLVFIPHFDFSAGNAVIGIILIELIGLVCKFKLFDHAAHLGGSLFGVLYAFYGEELVWRMWREKVIRWYRWLKNE